MIRAYNDGHKGATAFFRNRPFLDELFAALRPLRKHKISILVHACSVGAEPYSLALWWLHRVLPGWSEAAALEIVSTDVDAAFLSYAQQGRYPAQVLSGMSAEEQSWFETSAGGISVPDAARKLVRFLPPMSFVDGAPEGQFDATLVMNALTYVSASEQSKAIAQWSSYTRHVLAITAFHPDSIMQDLVRIGFAPHMNGHRQIHEAWGDRLAPGPVLPSSPDYSWRLPPYDVSPSDYAYRYGAIFQRR
jgi:hypothetical protein